ncbi:hypothetical protein ACTFIR_006520 [Dictyostelium discoideum]
MKKDNGVNIDYANFRFHKEYFEWGYKCVNYDLSRIFAYKNIMALIIHTFGFGSDINYTTMNHSVPEKVLPNIISFDQFI